MEELKKIIKCSNCFHVWKNTETTTNVKCPSCGKKIDARTRKKYNKERVDSGKLKQLSDYLNNPAKRNISHAETRKRKRMQALMIVGKGILECCNCGCDNPNFLEINHIDGGGTKERETVNQDKFYKEILSLESTKKLNLLCKICNALHYLELMNGKLPYKIIWDKQ